MRTMSEINTMSKAIKAKTPSIGLMRRTFGNAGAEALIKLWVLNLIESLGVKRSMSESQIDETAFTIVQDFPHVTIADVNLIFKGMKTGAYGEFYENINMAKVVGIFRKYFEERLETAAQMSLDEHSQLKESRGTSTTDLQREKDLEFLKFKAKTNEEKEGL